MAVCLPCRAYVMQCPLSPLQARFDQGNSKAAGWSQLGSASHMPHGVSIWRCVLLHSLYRDECLYSCLLVGILILFLYHFEWAADVREAVCDLGKRRRVLVSSPCKCEHHEAEL